MTNVSTIECPRKHTSFRTEAATVTMVTSNVVDVEAILVKMTGEEKGTGITERGKHTAATHAEVSLVHSTLATCTRG